MRAFAIAAVLFAACAMEVTVMAAPSIDWRTIDLEVSVHTAEIELYTGEPEIVHSVNPIATIPFKTLNSLIKPEVLDSWQVVIISDFCRGYTFDVATPDRTGDHAGFQGLVLIPAGTRESWCELARSLGIYRE